MEKFVFGRCEAPVVGLAEWSLCLVFGHLGLAVAEVSACASGKSLPFGSIASWWFDCFSLRL